MGNSVGPSYPGASIWTPHPKSHAAQANQRDATQQDLQDSNRAINDAVTRNQQTLSEVNQEGEQSVQHIRDDYAQQTENEQTKEEDAIAKQRQKGYEALRDLKRRQSAELARVQRQGETDLRNNKGYFDNQLYTNERQGEESLQNQKIKQAQELQYISSTGKADSENAKANQIQRMETLKKFQDQQFAHEQSVSESERQQMLENTQANVEQEHQKFQNQFQQAVNTDTQALDRLNTNATRELNQIRQDTAQKLAAYSSRQSDPFYKMMDMHASLHDEGKDFLLVARIPSHEQNHVSVSVKGNELVLSGTRRNEERLNLGPGRFRGTSSYQSFNESFPLPAPVDRNGITKEFRGDFVLIRVPKADPVMFSEVYKPKSDVVPERVRAERPHFPGNLPGVESPDSPNPKSEKTLT